MGTESDIASDSFLSIKAGQLLAKCGEKSIDSVLDWGKGQLAKGVFPSDYSAIYKGLCRQDGAASVAQCSRATELMEKVAATDSLKVKARGRALTQMASFANAVGNAKTLKLMKGYSGSDVPEIKKAAEAAVKNLEKK